MLASVWGYQSANKSPDVSQKVKIALREVGHKLLLENKDSSSVVKPIIALDKNNYRLEFSKPLALMPMVLINQVDASLSNADLPGYYVVEVIQCDNGEVAYSYRMQNQVNRELIPCGTRGLPAACYYIMLDFKGAFAAPKNLTIYPIVFGVLVLIFLIHFIISHKSKSIKPLSSQGTKTVLGRYTFYPEQHKLVKEAVEISLSQKECEILELLTASPNQIIKREELSKKIWEDKGVVVGRSLDTYISKLRKKLQEDDSIKITNVHGVGYKLEIN